ncbi:MAG: 2-polyprenyl-6-hydroxyphenyl methylase / 3-demethylubiquinone-9 3-methyltransferase [Frankiaceae bacterium]|nr:2-polyprenyl-6-hydroxyphenyl methylase / 3-demethylubiquinone-9 3-methyltransferase [Frankiaceae bacterium]
MRRNDLAQYDDLADQWWQPRGAFAMLHWIARERAALVPAPTRPGALLVDVACGGGLLAPHLPSGYWHVGLDLVAAGLRSAREHGVDVLRADATALPCENERADVVVAGEVLEHVADPLAVVRECLRILKPGGTFVIDTIARTRQARLVAVTLAERLPGLAPKGIHDPALFVDRAALQAESARHGVVLRLQGLRPAPLDYLSWLAGRRGDVRLRRTRSTAVLFQGSGTKESA